MAENNDARVLFFFGRQLSVAVGIQQSKYRLMSILTTVVLKRLHKSSRSIFLAQTFDELNLRMHAIVVANVSADKSNHDDRGNRGNGCRGSRRLRTRLTRDEDHRKNQEQDPERGKHSLHRDREATSVQMKRTRLKLRKMEGKKMVRGGRKKWEECLSTHRTSPAPRFIEFG